MKKIKLSKNRYSDIKYVLVDDQDFNFLDRFKWSLEQTGGKNGGYYVRTHISMHRLILNPKDNELVDHKNRNSLDNRRSNLRIATSSQNMGNMKKHSDNKSGHKGVTLLKGKGKYVARIYFNGKQINLGRFKNKVKAGKAYKTASLHYFGIFSPFYK